MKENVSAFRLEREEKGVSVGSVTHVTCVTQITQVEGIFQLPEPVDPRLTFFTLVPHGWTHKRLGDWPDHQRAQGIFGN